MDNSKQYLKIYQELGEESFNKWGYYYPPKNWEDLNSWNYNTYEKFLKEKEDGVNKTEIYIKLLDTINNFGFYLAFQNIDYELLNNAIYQSARQQLLNNALIASVHNHPFVLKEVLNSFACNDFDIVQNFFPKNLEHSKDLNYSAVTINLMMVLYYEQTELRDAALKIADKFLDKKTILWHKYIVMYLKAIINEDAKEASLCLQELCFAYQVMEHSVMKLYNKLSKCFSSQIHGLYRFVRFVNKELHKNITQPTHFCFDPEFEIWQLKNNYPSGKLFYTYPPELNYMNKILEAKIPTVTLYNPYPNKKDLYKNVDKFITELTENIQINSRTQNQNYR